MLQGADTQILAGHESDLNCYVCVLILKDVGYESQMQWFYLN